MKHSTTTPTKAQQARLDAIHAMPCIACVKEAKKTLARKKKPLPQPFRTEAHHLVDKGTRKLSGGHDATIPLDTWHHRGICLEYLTAREMAELYGPSLARQKRAFVAEYGTERQLLAETNAKLSQGTAARALPPSLDDPRSLPHTEVEMT